MSQPLHRWGRGPFTHEKSDHSAPPAQDARGCRCRLARPLASLQLGRGLSFDTVTCAAACRPEPREEPAARRRPHLEIQPHAPAGSLSWGPGGGVVLLQVIHACTHPAWREEPHGSELEMFLGGWVGGVTGRLWLGVRMGAWMIWMGAFLALAGGG